MTLPAGGPRAAAALAVLLVAALFAACEVDAAPPPGAPTPVPVEPAEPDADLDPIPRTTDARLTINGAGATFPFVLYSKWTYEYYTINRGVQINYNSIGSGAGIRQVIERTVDFGGTDGPMNEEQRAAAGATVLHIPMAMGAVVPAYNLPGTAQLQLSQQTIAAIFLGDITRWDDPAIAEDNPGVELPDRGISVIYRSDGSGTTFIWTDFLSAVSEEWLERVGVGTSVRWPVGLGANGNEGVANQVRQIEGSIGYVELAYAEQNGLPMALLENREGAFVEAGLEAVSAAAAGMIEVGAFPEDLTARVVNAPGEESWPAAGFTWLLVYEDLSVLSGMNETRAKELVRYILWSLDADGGQQWNIPLHYAPLAPEVRELAYDHLKRVTFEGEPVWSLLAADAAASDDAASAATRRGTR